MSELYIQAEGSEIFWKVWPIPETIPAGSIREGNSYLFELRGCENASIADLFIDDIPIEALRSKHADNARWRWQPGFHAGLVEAMLHIPDIGYYRFEITTDPDLRKLTRNDFDTMVREILQDTFSLFSLSAFRKGIAHQSGNKAPPLARLEFLRSRVEEITEAIDAISHSPRHSLYAKDVSIPVHRVIRATGPEILKSFRSGTILTETITPSILPKILRGRLPAKIKQRQRCNNIDIPEHRQIKSCLKSWAAWLSNIADILEKTITVNALEKNKNINNWAIRTKKIAHKLNNSANSPFLIEVSEARAELCMSSLFRNDPKYNRFYRLWQDMNLGLAALFGDFLQMPLAKTHELYELWCFLRLLNAAIKEFGQKEVDLSKLFTLSSNNNVTLSTGAITIPIGPDKIICFQRRYREYWIEPNGEGSFSRVMIPDVVFSGTGLGGPEKKMIILDAKYRIDEGLNDALSSIHTYRDALVQEANNGNIEEIVTAAYLLTPHTPVLDNNFQKMSVPGRLFHPQYRGKFRFGAITLRPGMTLDEVQVCLNNIFSDATIPGSAWPVS
ncbi:DUF2357 domain-containing protein [Serratia sp. DD3]|uniref:DUF2357 domain-containing protein n=1 Tax=Serratia sp. DD3 TaxID=1410619 RepID=UPI0004D60B16|nr:DUF2357 domain-containing protein [Serratia sp. DD3]KEY60213.1 hypothetical protein SRDD_08420 [Serratia sp. DD3]